MTKEEYLNMYKEDKFAEVCAQLDSEKDELLAKTTELSNYVRELNNKCEDLDIWNNVEKVFMKLKSLPVEEFIELYSRMKKLIESPHYITTVNPELWNNSITTLHG